MINSPFLSILFHFQTKPHTNSSGITNNIAVKITNVILGNRKKIVMIRVVTDNFGIFIIKNLFYRSKLSNHPYAQARSVDRNCF